MSTTTRSILNHHGGNLFEDQQYVMMHTQLGFLQNFPANNMAFPNSLGRHQSLKSFHTMAPSSLSPESASTTTANLTEALFAATGQKSRQEDLFSSSFEGGPTQLLSLNTSSIINPW